MVGLGQIIGVYGQSTSTANSSMINSANQTQANQTINLLDANNFFWKSGLGAKILQTNDELSMIIDTDSDEKLYNRAYLDTQLNSTTASPPLELSLLYSFKSIDGNNATLAIEIRDKDNDSILSSNSFDKNQTSARFALTESILDRPIEIRIYVITQEPGSYVLVVKEASIHSMGVS